jgi:hypothetical protein
MGHDTVTYYNGKRYMKRVRRGHTVWGGTGFSTYITFAYRGVPDECPAVISYTIRQS